MRDILWIDLTTEKIRVMPADESLSRGYIGGCGLEARLLYSELKPGSDPLAEENDLPNAGDKRKRHMSICILLISTHGLARVSPGSEWNGI
jgi:hypothetical protein